MSVIDLAFVVNNGKQIVLVHALRAWVPNRRKTRFSVNLNVKVYGLSDLRENKSVGIFARTVEILHGE